MVYFSTILYLRFLKLTSRKDRTRGYIILSFETSFDLSVNPFRSMRESLTLVGKQSRLSQKVLTRLLDLLNKSSVAKNNRVTRPAFLVAMFGYIHELPESRKPQCIAKGHGVGLCPKAATFPHRLIAEAIYGVAMLVESCYFSCIA